MGGAARPVLTSVGFWRRFPMVRLGVWVGLLSPPYWPVSGVLLCSSVSVPVAVCAGWWLFFFFVSLVLFFLSCFGASLGGLSQGFAPRWFSRASFGGSFGVSCTVLFIYLFIYIFVIKKNY